MRETLIPAVATILVSVAITTPAAARTNIPALPGFTRWSDAQINSYIRGKTCTSSGGSISFGADGRYRAPSGRGGKYRIAGGRVYISFDDGKKSWYDIGAYKGKPVIGRWVLSC